MQDEFIDDQPPVDQPTTVRGWLETLPDGYRERAIDYTDRSELDESAGDLSIAVSRAFFWKDTEEGSEFWGLVANGELPPIHEKEDA
jgi:hypothetical protein